MNFIVYIYVVFCFLGVLFVYHTIDTGDTNYPCICTIGHMHTMMVHKLNTVQMNTAKYIYIYYIYIYIYYYYVHIMYYYSVYTEHLFAHVAA